MLLKEFADIHFVIHDCRSEVFVADEDDNLFVISAFVEGVELTGGEGKSWIWTVDDFSFFIYGRYKSSIINSMWGESCGGVHFDLIKIFF